MKVVNIYNVKKYSSNDLVLGQVLEIQNVHYVVLMLGVRFTRDLSNEIILMPEQFGAVLGLVRPAKDETYYNLKLKRS